MATINSPKGTHDIIGNEARAYEFIEQTCSLIAGFYGFDPIQTPLFEANELFSRSVGDATDIVRKEMYTFKDKGNRMMALRPEGTAGVVRSIISNKLYATNDLPVKYSYYGPMFRYERPQLGRYRQFHQYGVESVGVTSIYHDLEVILLAIHMLQAIGFDQVTTKINSLGTRKTRESYKEALKDFYKPHLDHVCEDCKVRYENNPLRLLDCKVPTDAALALKAPQVSDFLTKADQADLTFVKNALEGLGIETTVDYGLVRGLDYYSGIIFEFSYIPDSKKDYGAIGGGGRYDKLVSELGGPDLIGVGFAFGIERLHHILSEEGKLDHTAVSDDFVIMTVGEAARLDGFSLLTSLRTHEVRTNMNFEDKTFKSLFKIAEARGAEYALIIGDDEVKEQVIQVKNLKTQTQVAIPYKDILAFVLNLMDEKYGSHDHDHHHDHDECSCDHHGGEVDDKCNCKKKA